MTRLFHRRNSGPVYREVLSASIKTAWEEKRFWPLAILASILFTSGTYDVILKAVRGIGEQSSNLLQPGIRFSQLGHAFGAAVGDPANLLGMMSGLQAVIVIAILLLTLAALSCTAQAGLTYALGASRRGMKSNLADAFRIGGAAFWPVVALNALSISTLWILRFLVAFPLYLVVEETSSIRWILYLISFMFFVAASFAVAILHIFALNAMVLQGAPVSDALIRAYMLLKKHWVVTVETGLMLLVIAAAVGALFVCLYFLALVPLFAALISAALLQSELLLDGVIGMGLTIFFLGLLIANAFLTQMQYATWTNLYRRLGEGGVLPKIHRLARALAGNYSVPQG